MVVNESDEKKIIVDTTVELRHRDRSLFKRYGFGNYLTYFDADDYCLLADYKPFAVLIPSRNMEVVVCCEEKYRDPKGRLTVHASQIVELQFATPMHIDALVKTQNEFGGGLVGEMSSDGLKDMEKYCKKIDEAISEVCIRLREKKISQPLTKIWGQMGGETIPKSDRLAQRILYFREIAKRYGEQKDRWRAEMKRIGLLK